MSEVKEGGGERKLEGQPGWEWKRVSLPSLVILLLLLNILSYSLASIVILLLLLNILSYSLPSLVILLLLLNILSSSLPSLVILLLLLNILSYSLPSLVILLLLLNILSYSLPSLVILLLLLNILSYSLPSSCQRMCNDWKWITFSRPFTVRGFVMQSLVTVKYQNSLKHLYRHLSLSYYC